MTELSETEAAIVARFEAAPYPAEVLLSHLRRPAAPSEPPAETQQDDEPSLVGAREVVSAWIAPGQSTSHLDLDRLRSGIAAALAARPSADTETLRRVETLCAVWETEADSYSVADHRDKAVEARRRAKSLRAALAGES